MRPTIQELLRERASKADDFERLVDRLNATAPEAENPPEYEQLKTEIRRIDKTIGETRRNIHTMGITARPVPGPDGSVPYAESRYRAGKLVAFKGPDAEERAFRGGQWARAVLFDDEKSATWCRDHGVQITKAQGEGTNIAGGFLVPTEFDQSIIDLRESFGTFRQNCRVVPMGSDSKTVPRRKGGITAYWVGENASITESAKQWDDITLTARKLGAFVKLSTELDEDAIINVADDLAQEMAYAFAVAEDAAGWSGDGTLATYGGITGVRTKIIDGTHDAGKIVAATNHDTWPEIDATDLANLIAVLPKYAERGAKFYCSQMAWSLVFLRLIAAAGGNTVDTLSGGKPTRAYLGYPVVIDQTWPSGAASTDYSNLAMIGFGALELSARLGDRRGFRVAVLRELFAVNDQVGVIATERVDINVHDLGDNTTPGPFVCLIGQ